MLRLEVLRGVCAERSEHQVAELAAELRDRPAGAVKQQQRSNRAMDRKRGQTRIGRREYAGADSFFD
jgi:hypothetical protein